MNSNESPQQLCTTGIEHYVRWRADAMSYVNRAIDDAKDYALPRLVKGWMLHGGRDARFRADIDQLLVDARAVLPVSGERERLLHSSLEFASSGRGIEAATQLEYWLDAHPDDLLVQQLIQNELFWMGRAQWMREVTERAAVAWTEQTPGYGPFLSLRAFANEEAGALDDAERFGREAVEIDPADGWGAHAVAHVLMMKGEMRKGVEWLQQLSPNWEQTNQLKHHLWWHVCLFLLESRDYDAILELLTQEIRNPESPLVKASPAAPIDIQNYASLLLRLELYGVDVGERWQTLAGVCAERVNNHGNAFGNIHDVMVLCATGQQDKATDMIRSMRECYHAQTGSVALAYNAAAIPACEAILAHRNKDFAEVLQVLGSVRHDLNLMGASHNQRDVLYHLLVHAAEQEGRHDLRSIYLRDIERIGFCAVPSRAAYQLSSAH
ncbi:MAG: tetratricopeptide repeat protein [Gammaproteobacteria bacterium]|nr:tetratricopeptide repeat protein [Gammaproteobacteria bacterium]